MPGVILASVCWYIAHLAQWGHFSILDNPTAWYAVSGGASNHWPHFLQRKNLCSK